MRLLRPLYLYFDIKSDIVLDVTHTISEDDAVHEELDGFGAGDVEEEVYPLVVREGTEAGRAVDGGFEVAEC